jgi:RNA polymerase sigma-70 factor (ECF subfamily)
MSSQFLGPERANADPAKTQALLQYQPWLQLLARLEIESRFAGKFSASDAVQQTLLEAWRGWDAFRGEDEAGRRAWLREILAHQLAHLGRAFVTQKRDLARERSLDASLADTSMRLEHFLAADQTSPSAPLLAEEKSLELARVLEALPEDYRQVIILRNLEELPYEEIAERMHRSAGAVRMLWLRALAALQEQIRNK